MGSIKGKGRRIRSEASWLLGGWLATREFGSNRYEIIRQRKRRKEEEKEKREGERKRKEKGGRKKKKRGYFEK